MSSLTPYVIAPYPNFAAEEAERPYELPPVQETLPVVGVRAVEAEEDRVDDEAVRVADASEISAAARAIAENAARRRLQEGPVERRSATPAFDPVRDAERIRNNRAIRELIASLAAYDNSAAQEKFGNALNLFVDYSTPYTISGEAETAYYVPAPENIVYSTLGFSTSTVTPRDMRESIGTAIDRWLRADGVFLPSMLGYSSSDGFRFAPLTDAARLAQRSRSVLATHERNRIATYLRDMARLTPRDFMFYDTTGLGALSIEERREFLARVDTLLEQAGIEERAVDLQYAFDQQGRLLTEQMELDDEAERLRLEALAEQISGYYGALLQSVKQYGAGIISASMA